MINGRKEAVEMAEEEALAEGRVWGQCMFSELHMSESILITGSRQLSLFNLKQRDAEKKICGFM